MLEGLAGTFEPAVLLALVLGVLGGIVIGGLPGLTATMGVALLVPFTFTMDPAMGLVAIGGLYVGAMYGDAVPAALVNTPGTPSALATTFDGFPLTRQGKGQHALAAAGIASAFGTVVGGFALLLLSPPLARFALSFGPPELFWVGVFGLSVIASLASGSLWKGLAGGTLGLLLSTVGIATMGAESRYTFGFSELNGGVHIVVALIGLFAVPQALRLIETHRERPRLTTYRRQRGAVAETFRYVVVRPLLLLRSSVIGVLVGILPGAGSPIASLISYSEAVRWSRHPERFGKGALEGVAASESASNSAAPAAMIPLLTIGVPGSAPAAVLLGAMLLHGLRPGAELYEQHPDVVFTFIWSMIFAGLAVLVLSAGLSRFLVRLASFPVYFLAPLIMLLSVVGSFAIRNNYVDVGVMLFFGLVGYVGDKLGFSAGPIALGLILGPIVEAGYLSAVSLVSGGRSYLDVFVLRPVSAVVILLIVLSLCWPLISRRLRVAAPADTAEGEEPPGAADREPTGAEADR